MYLRGSKWSMRQRRKPVNWFMVIVLLLLISGMVYVDRVVVPTIPPPFLPTPTSTRDPESYVTEANDLFTQGKLIDSIDAYNNAIRIKPNDATIYVALARVQILAGKYDDAQTSAENALLLSPDNSMAMAVLGWAQDKKGNYSDADASLKNALKLDPNNGSAHAYYAFLLADMFSNNTGPYVDPIQPAIAESNAAISLSPGTLEAHWSRAKILEITGNREEAVSEYLAAININDKLPDLHLDLGVVYRAIGDIDKALEQYTLANTLNPTDYLASLYSSRALAAIGEYAKAIQYAQQAVNDSPTDPYLRGNLGVWLYKNFQWSEALDQLSLAVNGGKTQDGQTIPPQPLTSDDPRIGQYFYTYAILLAKNGRCGEALPVTAQILTVLPDDADAAYNAQYAQGLCQASLETPPASSTSTPAKTSTPTP